MQKTIGILAALLIAQVVLAVGMSFTGPDLTAARPDTPLLGLGEHSVDRLIIEGPDNQQLALSRQGDGWVLPEKENFPADNARVDRLLTQLRELKHGLAVATTEGAQKRFKVSEDDFERYVALARDDEMLAELYLGTSPGMRRVHARTRDDDAVYAVNFGIHNVPARLDDWEDKSVLQIPRGEIEKIILGEFTLKAVPVNGQHGATSQNNSQNGVQTTWSIDTRAEGEIVNQANAGALVGKIAELRIGSVLGSTAKPEYGLEHPELVIGLQQKGGQESEYHLGKHENGNDFVIKSTSRSEYFRLPNYTGQSLIEAASREKLVTTVPETTSGGETSADSVEARPTESPDETDRGSVNEEALP